ncbi:MAG: 4Fe-4S cluster-binding domain-containing protein, partial [Acidobacteria bacterium]
MQQSMFNVRVPLADRGEVFLMNTLTDAQLIVSDDIAGLLDRLSDNPATLEPHRLNDEQREALVTLTEHGFIVPSRGADTEALNRFFADYREDTDEMRVTVLTTLQCNFACDYCFQGDHGDHNKHADRMSLDDSARLSAWIDERLDELKPKRLTLTFFGGEPLLNMPVVYDQAERAFAACRKRGVTLALGIITNGLLLTE